MARYEAALLAREEGGGWEELSVGVGGSGEAERAFDEIDLREEWLAAARRTGFEVAKELREAAEGGAPRVLERREYGVLDELRAFRLDVLAGRARHAARALEEVRDSVEAMALGGRELRDPRAARDAAKAAVDGVLVLLDRIWTEAQQERPREESDEKEGA